MLTLALASAAVALAGADLERLSPPPAPVRRQPAVVLVAPEGAGPADFCCADWLARAGYALLVARYRPSASYTEAVDAIQDTLRLIRTQASAEKLDPARIALLGVGPGGTLAALAALRRPAARVQAVVSLNAWADFRGEPKPPPGWASLLSAGSGLAEGSPVMHMHADAPPFLLVHGDANREAPLEQAAHFQFALHRAAIPCDLILIRGGGHDVGAWSRLAKVRDWEAETLAWLARLLR